MHYYQFHIGDYRKDTSHLTPIEHYIYRSLIDWYYLDEKPIPSITHSVIRRLGLVIDYTVNVENVLADFFILHDDGYHHGRIDKELEHYHVVCLKNKDNGIKGGRPRKTHSVTTGNPNVTQNNPDVTLTNNQEPITKNHKKTSISKNFVISEDVKNWAEKNGHSRLEERLDHFILSCEAKNYQYSNWDSAFRKAISDDWAKFGKPTTSKPSSVEDFMKAHS